MAIKRRGKKFIVTDRSGSKILGTHDTSAAAIKQLAAIEASKKQRGK